MTLLILGAIIIFLISALGIGLLTLTMPKVFDLINNNNLLEKLFLIKTINDKPKKFGHALSSLNSTSFENVIIYIFVALLMVLLIALVVITSLQIAFKKNRKQTLRLYYSSFVLLIFIFMLMGALIIFTGIWWYTFVLGFIAIGSFLVQNSILGLIKKNNDQMVINFFNDDSNTNQKMESFSKSQISKPSGYTFLSNDQQKNSVAIESQNISVQDEPLDFNSFEEQFKDLNFETMQKTELEHQSIEQSQLPLETDQSFENANLMINSEFDDTQQSITANLKDENLKMAAMYQQELEKPISLTNEGNDYQRNTYLNQNDNVCYENNLDENDILIDPDKVYYHSSTTGQTVEINSKEVNVFLFDDEKINENITDNVSSKNDANLHSENNAMLKNEKVLAFSMDAINYGALPKSKNNSAIKESKAHYHHQYPNHMFDNDNCPICSKKTKNNDK